MNAIKKKIPLALGLLLSGAILFYLFSKHFAAVEAIGDKIEWGWVWVSAFCAFGSYSMAGFALEEALLIFEHKLLLTESLGIALVSPPFVERYSAPPLVFGPSPGLRSWERRLPWRGFMPGVLSGILFPATASSA